MCNNIQCLPADLTKPLAVLKHRGKSLQKSEAISKLSVIVVQKPQRILNLLSQLSKGDDQFH